MNLKKINKKGFVLAETLVVTVFLMVIFTMIYSNFFPIIGEYEKRETYDDMDSKYAAYWIKKIVEDPSYAGASFPSINIDGVKKYTRFSCANISEDDKKNVCISLMKEFEVDCGQNPGSYDNCDIFITNYNITDFKSKVLLQGGTELDSKDYLKDYIETLPNFSKPYASANYRVIISFHHKRFADYYSYANMEVRRG